MANTPQWLDLFHDDATQGMVKRDHARGVNHDFDVVHGTQDALTTAEDLFYTRIVESQISVGRPNLPFPAAVLIAVGCSSGPLTLEQLLLKIFDQFPYWGAMAATALLQSGNVTHNSRTPSELLKDALCQYDLPLKVARGQRSGKIYCDLTSINETVCALRKLLPPRSLNHQLEILQSRRGIRLTPVPFGHASISTSRLATQGYTMAFDRTTWKVNVVPTSSRLVIPATAPRTHFLSLPAEMRNEIYKLVLQYPASGIRFASDRANVNVRSRKYIFTQTRNMHEIVPLSSWEHRNDEYAPIGGQPPLLRSYAVDIATAILRVNRQIRYEAAPIFYGNNRFHFCNLEELLVFADLKTFNPEVRQILFTYDAPHKALANQALSELYSFPGLRFLSMAVDQTQFDKYKGYAEGVKKYTGLHRLKSDLETHFPNLKTFKIEGSCEKVARDFIPAVKKRTDNSNKRALTFTYCGQHVCLQPNCQIPGCADTRFH